MDNALITVRASSSRLPRKCFLPFGKINVLEHIIKRAEHYNLKPIVCTTNNADDEEIVKIAIKLGVQYFCGSSINKLQRWRDCCRKYKIKIFLFENVRGILSGRWTSSGKKGEIFRSVFKDFQEKLGKNYYVRWELIKSSSYGIPQNRPRLFMVGLNKSLKMICTANRAVPN